MPGGYLVFSIIITLISMLIHSFNVTNTSAIQKTSCFIYWNVKPPKKRVISKYRNQLCKKIVEKKSCLHKDMIICIKRIFTLVKRCFSIQLRSLILYCILQNISHARYFAKYRKPKKDLWKDQLPWKNLMGDCSGLFL